MNLVIQSFDIFFLLCLPQRKFSHCRRVLREGKKKCYNKHTYINYIHTVHTNCIQTYLHALYSTYTYIQKRHTDMHTYILTSIHAI